MPAKSRTVAIPRAFNSLIWSFENSRNQAKVIVVAAALLASFAPAANFAMLDRIGISFLCRQLEHRLAQ